MKKYYRVSPTSASKETGNVYPQSDGMIENYNYDSPNSIWNLSLDHLSNDVSLDSFKLVEKANATDVISTVSLSFGFLCSIRFKNVMELVSLPEHIFYSASLIKDKLKYSNYFLFHYLQNLHRIIDYNKTEFYEQDSFGEQEDLSINSLIDMENFVNVRSTLKVVKADKYFLNKECDYDLFGFGLFNFNCFISERLKNLILDHGLTGLGISDNYIEIYPPS